MPNRPHRQTLNFSYASPLLKLWTLVTSIFLLSYFISSPVAVAAPSSYRLAHPVGWMHLLPVGEMPGWESSLWLNTEIQHANIWNRHFEMRNTTTGDTLAYKADFEQGSVILDFGFAISSTLAMSLEIPYASRGGGFLDSFIDDFHVFIGSERFLRQISEENQNRLILQENGEDILEKKRVSGIDNLKYKLKWWPIQWIGPNGSCPCGLAFSGQVKFPLRNHRLGLTSGGVDYSFLTHLGFPINQYSALWMTSGFTYTETNKNLRNWPIRRWHQMYELSMDLALNSSWGILLQARAESPFMNKGELEYIYDNNLDEKERIQHRVASGWNSLVHWRGSQSIGGRYRFQGGHQLNLLMLEDWGIGHFDERGDALYVNNAPDVAFVLQFHAQL